MRCPFCGSEDTQVKDSRPSEDGQAIRRRRFCLNCDERFTTFERIQLRELTVLKKDGTRRPFDRDKLHGAICVAVRKRSINETQIDRLVNSIVRHFESSGESEIHSGAIGQMVMDSLKKLDPVAYVRFASVYRDFREVEDFNAAVQDLQEG